MSDQWQIARQLSPKAYRSIIEFLGMSQVGAGRYLGVSDRTARRFVSGDAEIPASAVLLLRSLIAHGDKPVVPKRKRPQPPT
jgi:DNA-binding transcriptional regulator YiaG